MKIPSNSIGNYNPLLINNQHKVNLTNDLQKTDAVTKEEKEFFVQLYPENKNEILEYHFYKPTGKMGGVSLGINFDKRG